MDGKLSAAKARCDCLPRLLFHHCPMEACQRKNEKIKHSGKNRTNPKKNQKSHPPQNKKRFDLIKHDGKTGKPSAFPSLATTLNPIARCMVLHELKMSRFIHLRVQHGLFPEPSRGQLCHHRTASYPYSHPPQVAERLKHGRIIEEDGGEGG